MGRSLSPIMRRELELYVKDLDSAIPIFIAEVSETETKQTGEHTISLYEVLARVHGTKIAPQIDHIMSTIVKTLSSSAGATALHRACSKVVTAIARYAIDPTTAEGRKRHVVHGLCKPLSDCLLGSQESLSSGAALCLQALVESDNWRFASNEMVNEVCQNVAGALEKHSQTESHMALVSALAKHNSLIVESYARLLILSGLKILDAGFVEENSQKRLSAIRMERSLLRYLDPRSVSSELELVITEMVKCQSERVPFVSGAAFGVLQIAKRICINELPRLGKDNTRMRNACSSERLTASPESQAVNSFAGNDQCESSNSMNHGDQSLDCSRKGVKRRLWRRCENGVLDVSLKGGIFSDIARGDSIISEYEEDSHNHGDNLESFAGFAQRSAGNEVMRSNTPSRQQSTSHMKADDVKIFTSPRKLNRSPQDEDGFDIGLSEKQTRRSKSPITSKFARTPVSMHGQNNSDRFPSGGEQFHGSSEVTKLAQLDKPQLKKHHKSTKRVCGIFVGLFAVFLFLLVICDQDDHYGIAPT